MANTNNIAATIPELPVQDVTKPMMAEYARSLHHQATCADGKCEGHEEIDEQLVPDELY
jgi:hypothetical protein